MAGLIGRGVVVSQAAMPESSSDAVSVLRLADIDWDESVALLRRFGLTLTRVDSDQPIPGSFWGDDEAGVIGEGVYARSDTPVHSLLHEAGHLIVLPIERRRTVHTNATDSDIEEDATCYLQILLADALSGVGRHTLMSDMDVWGYSFRLGSTAEWFFHDASDARHWLVARGLLNADGHLIALLAPGLAAV